MHLNRERRRLGAAERSGATHTRPAMWRWSATAFATMVGGSNGWAAALAQPLNSSQGLAQRWVPGPVAYAALSTMAALLAMIILVMMVYAARHGVLTLNRLLATLAVTAAAALAATGVSAQDFKDRTARFGHGLADTHPAGQAA